MPYSPASSSFPTSKTTFIDPTATDEVDVFDHAGLESTQNDAIEKIENTIGVTGSGDSNTLDFKLTNPASVDPGHVHTYAGISGTVDVAHGGTGATSLTGVLVGNGTAAVSTVTAPSGTIVGTSDSQTLTNKTLTTPTLTLKQSTTPTPTAEGDIQWDTDDNKIKVGDGATTKTFSDDSYVLSRTNHTGTQLSSTISDLNESVEDIIGTKIAAGSTGLTVSYNDGTGTTTITPTKYVFNVKEYGAMGTNNIDDTAAIQAAIDAAELVHGTVYIPDGNQYQLYSALVIDAPINFIGNGPQASRLLIVGNHDGIQINNGGSTAIEHLTFRDFSIVAASTLSSGAAIRVGKISKSLFDNIAIDYNINTFAGRCYDGIVINAAQQTVFTNLIIQGVVRNGWTCSNVSGHTVVDIFLKNSQFLENSGDCILLTATTGQGTSSDVEGIYIENVTTYYGASSQPADALHINSLASSCVQNVFVYNSVLDSCRYGANVEGAGRISQISFFNTWFSFNGVGNNGYFGPNVTDLLIDGGHCVLSQLDGFFLDGIQGGRIMNVSFENNGKGSTGTYYGLNLGDSDDVMVQGCKFYNTTNFSQRQNGIKSTSGATGCIVKNNVISVPGYTATSFLGTGHKIVGNEGYNPVGLSAVTAGTSPLTYTAGFTPETLYIRSGSVSSIAKGGITLYTATDNQIELQPGESAVITYTATDYALNFLSTTDNVVSVPNAVAFQARTAWTIEAFIELASQPTNAAYIFYYYNGGNTGYRLAVPGGTRQLQGSGGNGSTFQGGTGAGTIPLSTRTHVAATWDGTNIRTFIAGTLVGTSALAAGTGSGNPGQPILIGNNSATIGDRAFPGKIDDLRISSTARYTATFTPPISALSSDANTIELWHFDEGTGTTTTGTAGNVGTLKNTSLPTWVTGLTSQPTIYTDKH